MMITFPEWGRRRRRRRNIWSRKVNFWQFKNGSEVIPGVDVVKKFCQRFALWLDVASHVTSFNQLGCFISALRS